MKRTSLVRASSRLPQFIAPFLIVSLSVWITLPARFDRFFNLFQSTTKHCMLELKYFVFETFYLPPFGVRGLHSRDL